MRRFWFGKVLVMILLFITLISALLMTLWNWLMPYLFELPEITFWQAVGLLLLSKIIFGLGRGGKPEPHRQHGPPWKRWKNRWQNMPEEQRERLKQRIAEKWCRFEESMKKESTEKQEE